MGIGQAAEKNAVDHAEHRRGRPDPQGQSEDGDQRECRAFPKSSESKSQVFDERVEKLEAALLAMQLFGLFDAAEFTPGGIACFHRTHTAANILLREHLQMRSKFGVEVLVQLPLREQAAPTRAENAQPAHIRRPPCRREGGP